MINIGIGIPFGQRSAGIDPQAKIAFDSLQSAGFTTPQGITGINAAFKTIKTIYGTSDITTAISFFGDPSLAYQIGAGSGTTLGQAIRTLPNLVDNTRATDAVQTTAASQPLLLVHSGQNYYFNDSTGASSISKSISNISTGTNYVFEFGLDSAFVAGDIRTIVSHGSGGSGSPLWVRWSTNLLVLDYRNPRVEIPSNTINANSRFFKIEFTKNSATSYTITFFEKANIGDSYTINRTASLTGTSTVMDTINTAWVGSLGSTFGLLGKILFVNCTVDGNPIYNFQASNYVASASQTTLPDNVSGTWTINTGTATTGYKGQLTYRTTVLTDGIDDSMTGTMSASMIFTINNNHGVNFVAKRYINSNNQNIVRFAGDYADNNSSQMWFEGGNLSVNKSLRGTALVNQRTTGNYTLAQYFSYSESIVYGGTTTQRLNATNNSGTYFNNTTNKPAIVSGNMVLFQSSAIGILNGSFNTLIVTNDGTKFVQINDYMRQINNI